MSVVIVTIVETLIVPTSLLFMTPIDNPGPLEINPGWLILCHHSRITLPTCYFKEHLTFRKRIYDLLASCITGGSSYYQREY